MDLGCPRANQSRQRQVTLQPVRGAFKRGIHAVRLPMPTGPLIVEVQRGVADDDLTHRPERRLRLWGIGCSGEDLRAEARRVRILAGKAKPDLAVLIPNEP